MQSNTISPISTNHSFCKCSFSMYSLICLFLCYLSNFIDFIQFLSIFKNDLCSHLKILRTQFLLKFVIFLSCRKFSLLSIQSTLSVPLFKTTINLECSVKVGFTYNIKIPDAHFWFPFYLNLFPDTSLYLTFIIWCARHCARCHGYTYKKWVWFSGAGRRATQYSQCSVISAIST